MRLPEIWLVLAPTATLTSFRNPTSIHESRPSMRSSFASRRPKARKIEADEEEEEEGETEEGDSLGKLSTYSRSQLEFGPLSSQKPPTSCIPPKTY